MNESQLVKTIKAHIAKGDKAQDKAEQHYISAGQHLKTLKAQHGGTWAEWEALLKDKIGIGKSHASELMQIADGRKTVEDVRADTNKRKLEHRASVPERRGRTVEPGCPECGYTLAYPEPCSEGGEHWACGQCGYVLCKKVCDCDGPLVLMKKWSELFPEGREIFYEGDDPKGFRKQIKAEFGFDPGPRPDQGFHCPPEYLDAIYGSGRFRMGS